MGLQQVQERIGYVLLAYRQTIPSTRLCDHCQMEHLARKEKIEYCCTREEIKTSVLNWAAVVMLGRLESWYEYHLAKKLHGTGWWLIYIMDDLILLPSYAINGHWAIQVEESAIDPVSYRPLNLVKLEETGFAEAIDRIGAIESIIGETLTQLKQGYGKRICLGFFGAIPSVARKLGAEYIPNQCSYAAYRRTLNSLEWDIGLVPVLFTPFYARKRDNKFEYAATGIMGVFSATGPNTRLKAMNASEVLCENVPCAWYEALRIYIDPSGERETLRRRCMEMEKTKFFVVHSALTMLENTGEARSPQEGKMKVTEMHALMIRSLGHAVLEKWSTHELFDKSLDGLRKQVTERKAA